MLLTGILEDHVAEIDREAEEMLAQLIKQMAEQEVITEQVKARNPMEWVRRLNIHLNQNHRFNRWLDQAL